MSSKIGKIVWAVLIIVFVALWIYEVVAYCKKYAEEPFVKETKWVPEDELPYPSLVMCIQNPVNESAVLSPQADRYRLGLDRNIRFIRYLKNLLNPLTPGQEKLTISERYMTATESDFVEFFNGTGRNKTTVESMLHTCKQVVASCSVGGEDVKTEDCCSGIRYLATPKGICFVRHSKEHQKHPGVDHALKFRLKMDKKAENQGDSSGMDLYLFDGDTELSSIQDAVTLESGKSYMIEMDLGNERMFTNNCRKERHEWERRREVKQHRDTDKRFRCLESRIKEECGCVPFASLWRKGAEPEQTSAICTTNQTEYCAKKWLENWSIELNAEMKWRNGVHEKNRLCKPKIPCSRLFWNVKERAYPMKATSGIFETSFALFYRHMVIQVETERLLTSFRDLLHEIGLAACIWFVLFHIIFYIVRGVQCCLCAKKNSEQNVQPTFQHMTGIVGAGEKYQQTQTDG